MASKPKAATMGKTDRQIDAFLNFAGMAQKNLAELKDKVEIRKFDIELEKQIYAIKCLTTERHQRRNELNLAGTNLWNQCTRLNHDEDPEPFSRKTLVSGRIFAFQLLVLAYGTSSKSPSDLIRLGKLAIKTGRSCVEAGEIELALLALQKAVDLNGLLQTMQDKLAEDERIICKRQEAEYFILRTVVSWKEGRLDVAEHMYGKSESLLQGLSLKSAENLADALFEIGNDFLQNSDFPMAAKWLERAYKIINNQELEQLSREAIELRLAILQALVHSFTGLNTAEGFQKAENHVASIELELGNKLVVLLLRLEILQKAPGEVFDGEAYANILQRMMRSTALSDSTFKLLVSHIRKLGAKSPSLALQVLDQFLLDEVIPSARKEWVECGILLRVMLSTDRRDTIEIVGTLKSIFDRAHESLGKPLAVESAQAVLTLIWKKVDSNSIQGQLDLCESWCRLAIHALLERRGLTNTGKIARKLILCALERNDLEAAQEMFMSLEAALQNHPMTMYLALKLALRRGDSHMASNCIEVVAKSTPKDPKFLYACCLDAQQSGDKLCTLKALKFIADKHELNKTDEIHFPALLRSMIRIQVSFLGVEDLSNIDGEMFIDDLCKTFEGVLAMLQRDPRDCDGAKVFTISELNWFSKNAYNLGVKHAPAWNLQFVVRMLDTCSSIIQYYPKDIPTHVISDILLRDIFCHFMIAICYIALARSADNIEIQLQEYLHSRKHIKAFEARLDELPKNDDECHHDLMLKLGTLLVFDSEASIHLKAWDELPILARKLGTYRDLSGLQSIADVLLRTQPPTQVVYSTLRIIINEIFELEKFDISKLAKYMRCLLKMTVSDPTLSLKLIEEISSMVKQAAEFQKPFPDSELEWFAITAYNQAIDFNLSQEDELSQKWIGHALTIVHHLRDGGVLEKVMQDGFTKLCWGPA